MWNGISYISIAIAVPLTALLTVSWNLIEQKSLDWKLSDPNLNWKQVAIPGVFTFWYIWFKSDEIIKVWVEEWISDLNLLEEKEKVSLTNSKSEEESSNIPIVLFGMVCIIFGIFVYYHSETVFVVQQNSMLESIIRDQASVVDKEDILRYYWMILEDYLTTSNLEVKYIMKFARYTWLK